MSPDMTLDASPGHLGMPDVPSGDDSPSTDLGVSQMGQTTGQSDGSRPTRSPRSKDGCDRVIRLAAGLVEIGCIPRVIEVSADGTVYVEVHGPDAKDDADADAEIGTGRADQTARASVSPPVPKVTQEPVDINTLSSPIRGYRQRAREDLVRRLKENEQ